MTLLTKEHKLYSFKLEELDSIYALMKRVRENTNLFEFHYQSLMFIKKSTRQRRLREGYIVVIEWRDVNSSIPKIAHMLTMPSVKKYTDALGEKEDWIKNHQPIMDCYNRLIELTEDMTETTIGEFSDNMFFYHDKNALDKIYDEIKYNSQLRREKYLKFLSCMG